MGPSQFRIAVVSTVLTSLLLSQAGASFARSTDLAFPMITLTLKNDRQSPVNYICSASGSKMIETLRAGESVAWRFREVFTPMQWCYLQSGEAQFHGFFWAFKISWQCIDCLWSIRDDGPFILQNKNDKRTWTKVQMWMRNDAF